MANIWNGWYWHLGSASFIALSGAIATSLSDCALAQITPDGTLPNNSIVTPQGNTSIIEGGTTAGGNLFHSFEELSVPTGGEAFFNNAVDIQNIISRVTGASISNIDGLLRANGTANLFLLNPNGIIFGPNATLNIGGSFLGSTASNLNFADGTQFSATAPQATPLLTVSVPIGLQYGGTAGGIQVQQSILRVQPGQTLALIGGDVSVEGGEFGLLRARGGRIELGGLAGAGMVEIEGQQAEGAFGLTSLLFPDSVERADVLLTDLARVNVAAGGGGSIAVNARNLELSGESILRAGIGQGLRSVGSVAGDITLDATGEIKASEASYVINNVQSQAMGHAGNIIISTGSLSLTDGSLLISSNYGQGNAGNVRIIASGNISFDSYGPKYGPSAVFTTVGETGIGNGGDIYIESSSLSLTNGGEVVAGVFQGGQGNSGNVTVKVKNSINISGSNTNTINGGYSSGIFTDPEDNSKGQGGEMLLNADTLTISDGGTLSARTRNAFRGGNIIVKVNNLDLTGGGQIITAAFDKGNAGDIIINATNGITISGSDPTFDARLAQSGRPFVDPVNSLSGLFANTDVNSTGQGGSINITTGQLQVRNQGQVTVSSAGSGVAGQLGITTNSIELDNGRITAETRSGNGGELTLDLKDLLFLSNSSQVSTTAGTAGAGGNGGNITINAPSGFIVAIPNENSDITANAFEGRGGNVRISASGIFGTQFRDRLTPESDITASSEFGVSGFVEINTPDVDPTQGLVELPTELVDASNSIATGCSAAGENEFIITGRGGLPPNPRQVLSSNAVQVDWVELDDSAENRASVDQGARRRGNSPIAAYNRVDVNRPPTQIVEAQGWIVDANGDVTLVATAPTAMPHSSWQTPVDCREMGRQ